MDYIKDKNKYRIAFQLTALPIILTVFIPIIILDISLEIYHRICFVLYGLKYVKRGDYIKIDRQKLKYLNWYQKLGCAYCGYANGLAGYWTAIAAKTEQYWCGILHKKSKNFHEPKHHKNFVKYGDKEGFENRYTKVKS